MSADVSQAQFRDAMSRLAAAVHIVTTMGPAGRAGFAATPVCSVTDTPPMLLVCLNHSASVYAAVVANGVLCVNTLDAGQQAVARAFGGKNPTEERFAQGRWRAGLDGVPVLEGALVSLECRIAQGLDVGTHRVLFCEVRRIAISDARDALVYLDRRFLPLGTT